MSDTSKTVAETRQAILNAIHANATEAADADYPESASVCAGTARQLAETYRLLDGQ